MGLKAAVPWYAKIGAKLILSRVPAGYRLWQHLDLFRHGGMDRPEYAFETFKFHFDRCNFPRKGSGFVALEVGPGDSLFSSLIGYALGAQQSYLVDSGRFADDRIALYARMAAYLKSLGYRVPDVAGSQSVRDVLEACNAHYCTAGLRSLREIPDASVDFIWSNAVLEHIREEEFADFMKELRRILRPDGICSHRVDLRDHLDDALHNLRFSRETWEADWMAQSGFYTNRIRYSRMLSIFEEAGFGVDVTDRQSWPSLPTARAKLHADFRAMSDDELNVRIFDVVLRPL